MEDEITLIEPGTRALNINLPSTSGTFELAGTRSPVVVFFYPKDDTPGCTSEAIDFTRLKPDFDRLGVSLVGISPDSVARHEKFAAKHGLTVELASDEDQTAANAYGVWVEKRMYGRIYMGIERSTFLIDANQSVTKVWRKVKVKGHADDVLNIAREQFG